MSYYLIAKSYLLFFKFIKRVHESTLQIFISPSIEPVANNVLENF